MESQEKTVKAKEEMRDLREEYDYFANIEKEKDAIEQEIISEKKKEVQIMTEREEQIRFV